MLPHIRAGFVLLNGGHWSGIYRLCHAIEYIDIYINFRRIFIYMYNRLLLDQIKKQLKLGKSLFLIGPRQVGKTTLCHQIKFDVVINLAVVSEKLKIEKDPTYIEKLINSQKKKVLVYIDEVQKIPELFDSIQTLIDQKKAQFVLTGSSVRKLKKHSDLNLAPGRIINFRLDPFCLSEKNDELDQILAYGQLPRIAIEEDTEQKDLELRSYVENYIEEEIRKETRLRSIAPFARFLELAALQSGQISNFSEISKELGPTVVTVQNYFQILEDTLFVERIDPYLKNASRKKLTKSSRYLFFDLGVRRILAQEASRFNPSRKGQLFEHFIGNEIIKWIRLKKRNAKLYYWRDSDGPEIDWLIECDGQLLPIEVKMQTSPSQQAAKHLLVFINEYKNARRGLIVSTSEIDFKVHDNVDVISYLNLFEYLDRWAK